ncbi:acyltransferase family protein [Eubacterium sp. AB3007]|uniref:acyltransferase family protein n=1 Tax=Eubacterium sp. AB3007 TaxID=1392487 RepID=UPI0004856CF1|nr:acyltransferase family protein [Eubacterium sp. AB3007]
MGKLFSNEPVNSGRQIELDLAKCLAIFFMIFLHCYFGTSYFTNEISLGMQRAVSQLFGGPFAAPVFMFAMGVGMVYSRNQAPAYLIKRGIKLIQLGFFVNIGEFFVPYFLSGNLLGDWDTFPIANGLLLFCIDILAFAGMAFILVGVLKKLKVSAKGTVVVALLLSIIGSIARFHDFGSNVPNLIAGYFIGSAGGFTAFPLFNWFVFPAVGLLFGEYYMRCNNKEKLLRLWPLGLIVSVAYFVVSWFIPGGFLSETHHYYFMTTIDAMFCLMCIYGVIGVCYLVSKRLPEGAVSFFSKTSSNLNTIYVIQWFLIPITYVLIVYFNRDIVFGDLSLVIVALLEMALSTLFASWYKKLSL